MSQRSCRPSHVVTVNKHGADETIPDISHLSDAPVFMLAPKLQHDVRFITTRVNPASEAVFTSVSVFRVKYTSLWIL